MPGPTPDAMREAFERWCRDGTLGSHLERHPRNGNYMKFNVELLWTGWQAAWAAAHKEQDDDGR